MNTLHTSHIFIFIFDHMQICSNCMLIARGQNKSMRPNVNYGQDRERKKGTVYCGSCAGFTFWFSLKTT